MLLELKDLKKNYPSPDGKRIVPVLRGIDLSVDRGESVAVVGPSGSGKSTLLNLIGGLDRPSSGTVILADRPLTGLSDSEMAEVRNRDVGFVFQRHHLLPQCSVLENVLVPTIPMGFSRDPYLSGERARRLLERVGMTDRTDYRPGQLSGGECQRTAFVRALINSPSVLLADEPTGSLDGESAESVGTLLMELNREEQTALIVVTHSPELARRMARVFYLKEGKLERER